MGIRRQPSVPLLFVTQEMGLMWWDGKFLGELNFHCENGPSRNEQKIFALTVPEPLAFVDIHLTAFWDGGQARGNKSGYNGARIAFGSHYVLFVLLPLKLNLRILHKPPPYHFPLTGMIALATLLPQFHFL